MTTEINDTVATEKTVVTDYRMQREMRFHNLYDQVLYALKDDPDQEKWGCLLRSLKNNRQYLSRLTGETRTSAGLVDAPGSTRYHHARLGGLVDHFLEMHQFFRANLPIRLKDNPEFSEANAWKGILLHDLHKAWHNYDIITDEQGQYVGHAYSDHIANQTMTSNGKTHYLLGHHHIALDISLMNVLECAEGGWAKNPPNETTVLAKMLYLCDDYSANVLDRVKSGKLISSKEMKANALSWQDEYDNTGTLDLTSGMLT